MRAAFYTQHGSARAIAEAHDIVERGEIIGNVVVDIS